MEAASAAVDWLMSRVARGDTQALEELYGATRARLLAVSLRTVGRHALAEEAVQDAFIKIWTHATRYRPEHGPALAWMSTIVRNHSLDIVRRGRDLSDVDDRLAGRLLDPGPSPESATEAARDARRICDCIRSLDPLHRQVLTLAYAHEMSHAQVACHLGKPLGTVKGHIRRGIFLLRECVAARPQAESGVEAP